MKTIRYYIAFLLLVLLLGGCVSIYHVEPFGEKTRRMGELNVLAVIRPSVVLLRDGRRIPAESIRVAADSTSWLNSEGAVQWVATPEIQAITFERRWQGALQGLGLGLLAGGAAGAIVGVAISSAQDEWPWREVYAAVYGTIGAAIGLPVGFLAGLGRGARDVYWFDPRPLEHESRPRPLGILQKESGTSGGRLGPAMATDRDDNRISH